MSRAKRVKLRITVELTLTEMTEALLWAYRKHFTSRSMLRYRPTLSGVRRELRDAIVNGGCETISDTWADEIPSNLREDAYAWAKAQVIRAYPGLEGAE
jgi:hypothetical protein